MSEVAQSCPTLCDPMDCSLPDSSVHGIFQATVLEWIAISFSSIFLTQGSNLGLPHCRQTLLPSEPPDTRHAVIVCPFIFIWWSNINNGPCLLTKVSVSKSLLIDKWKQIILAFLPYRAVGGGVPEKEQALKFGSWLSTCLSEL